MFGGVECTLRKSQDFVIMYSISQIECMKELSQVIIPRRHLFVVQDILHEHVWCEGTVSAKEEKWKERLTAYNFDSINMDFLLWVTINKRETHRVVMQ